MKSQGSAGSHSRAGVWQSDRSRCFVHWFSCPRLYSRPFIRYSCVSRAARAATAAGILLALDPMLGLATLATWLLVAFARAYSFSGGAVAAFAAPLYAFLMGGRDTSRAVAIIAIVLIGKHWANLQRLMAGPGPRL